MEHIGIDVHKVESQICILTESEEIIERRIRTQRERFAAVFGVRARTKILIESSTESEWVARCLEELGHEVVVADPNFAAMYATRSRKVKTDRRDARTLAEALQSRRLSTSASEVGSSAAGASAARGTRSFGPDQDQVHLARGSALAK
jgi:transposase